MTAYCHFQRCLENVKTASDWLREGYFAGSHTLKANEPSKMVLSFCCLCVKARAQHVFMLIMIDPVVVLYHRWQPDGCFDAAAPIRGDTCDLQPVLVGKVEEKRLRSKWLHLGRRLHLSIKKWRICQFNTV